MDFKALRKPFPVEAIFHDNKGEHVGAGYLKINTYNFMPLKA